MSKRLENIKANAKNLCKPTTARDAGVVLNVVWLETIEGLCDEVAQLEQSNTTLLEALERHTKMFEMVCDKVDFGDAFLDAKTIAEWNDASIQATEAIREAKEK